MVAGNVGATLLSTTGVIPTNLGQRNWSGLNVLDATSASPSSWMFSQGGNRAAVVTGGNVNGEREKTFTLASSGAAPAMPGGHRQFPSGSSSTGSSSYYYFGGAVIGTTYCTFGTAAGYLCRSHGMRLMRYSGDSVYEFAFGWPDDLPLAAGSGINWRAAGVGAQNALAISLDSNSYPQIAALEVCKG
jgi:hypothetical protein